MLVYCIVICFLTAIFVVTLLAILSLVVDKKAFGLWIYAAWGTDTEYRNYLQYDVRCEPTWRTPYEHSLLMYPSDAGALIKENICT